MSRVLSGYIIAKYNDMNNAYTTSRLIEEANRQGILLDIIGIHDSHIFEGKCYNNNKIIEKRDFSIVRFKSGHIKNDLNSISNNQYNRPDDIENYEDKYTQLRDLDLEKISKPKYILASLDLPYELLVQNLGLPFIVKGLCSSQGKEVFMIRNFSDYRALFSKYKGESREFIFQEFIKSSFGTDLRVFIIKGEVVACMKRKSSESFKANYSLGAKVEKYPTSKKIQEIAWEIYSKTNLFYIGLDLLFSEDEFIFCELNVNPGIEGIEKATSVNIAGELIRKIKGEI